MTANTLAVRRREIDARFWTSDDVCDLPTDSHRMMFIGLWCKADREGRMRDEPGPISRRVRSWDPAGGPALIDDLVRRGLARRYTVGGERFVWLPKFRLYQHVNPHEARSRIPPHPSDRVSSDVNANAHAMETPVVVERVAPEEQGNEADGSECTSEPSEPSEPSERKALSSELDLDLKPNEEPPPVSFTVVFEHWRQVMRHPDAKPIAKRKRAVAARFREGYTAEQLLQAIDGCALTPHNMGENDRHERYDDLELICRDGPHVERFIRNAQAPPKPSKGRADPNDGIMRRPSADPSRPCVVCGVPSEATIWNNDHPACAAHAKAWVELCFADTTVEPTCERAEQWIASQRTSAGVAA